MPDLRRWWFEFCHPAIRQCPCGGYFRWVDSGHWGVMGSNGCDRCGYGLSGVRIATDSDLKEWQAEYIATEREAGRPLEPNDWRTKKKRRKELAARAKR